MDDKNIKGPQDRSMINLSGNHEVQYWTKEFNISKQELERLALKHKGSALAVREELGK